MSPSCRRASGECLYANFPWAAAILGGLLIPATGIDTSAAARGGLKKPPRDLSRGVGLFLVVSAVLANPWLLGALLAPDGHIAGGGMRLLIVLGEILLLILGLSVLGSGHRVEAAHLLLVSGSILFTVAALILMLQLFYPLPPQLSGWRSRVKPLEQNELGFRGHSIVYGPQDFVVVLVGDSQIEADACAYDWMPESRLQEHLRQAGLPAKVFTVGANGYGQDQELLGLDQYLNRYRADLVLLWLCPANDVWNNVFPTHMPAYGAPKPTFWLERDDLFGPSEKLGEPIWSDRVKAFAIVERFWGSRHRDIDWQRRLPPPYQPLEGYTGPIDHWLEDRRKQGQIQFESLKTEKSHYSLGLIPRSPRTEYGIRLTRHLLHRIEDIVTSRQGKFIIFREKVDDGAGWPSREGVYSLDGALYRLSPEQFASSARELVEGFTYLEIPVRQVEKARVGPTDSHLNEHAVDELMASLAREVLPLAAPVR